MGLEAMSAYERKAWNNSLDVFSKGAKQIVPKRVREIASSSYDSVVDVAAGIPGSDKARDIMGKTLDGALSLTFRPAMRTVSSKQVTRRYAKRHPEVTSFSDIRGLPLETRDSMVKSGLAYTFASAGGGAATALAITGAEVSATVSGGVTAGVAVSAVAADTVGSLAMMGRTIGAVAASYGHDVSDPDEEIFAMGVLSLGAAGSLGAKQEALAVLSRLTQQMMRNATWKQLNEHLLVQVIAKVYQQLGFKLTHRKLAQVVPAVGVIVNASMSAQLTDQTFKRARAAYRLRSLSDQYGIDPSEWITSFEPLAGDEDVVDVIEVIEQVEAADPKQDENE